MRDTTTGMHGPPRPDNGRGHLCGSPLENGRSREGMVLRQNGLCKAIAGWHSGGPWRLRLASAGSQPGFEFHWPDGHVSLDEGECLSFRERGPTTRCVHRILVQPLAPPFGFGLQVTHQLRKDRYHDDHEAFARAVRDGTPPPVTAAVGARTLAVLDAARQSAAEGRTITLTF